MPAKTFSAPIDFRGQDLTRNRLRLDDGFAVATKNFMNRGGRLINRPQYSSFKLANAGALELDDMVETVKAFIHPSSNSSPASSPKHVLVAKVRTQGLLVWINRALVGAPAGTVFGSYTSNYGLGFEIIQKKLFISDYVGTTPLHFISFNDITATPDSGDYYRVTPAAPARATEDDSALATPHIVTSISGNLTGTYTWRVGHVITATGVDSKTINPINAASTALAGGKKVQIYCGHPLSIDGSDAILANFSSIKPGVAVTSPGISMDVWRRKSSSGDSRFTLIPEGSTGLTTTFYGRQAIEDINVASNGTTVTIVLSSAVHSTSGLASGDVVTFWDISSGDSALDAAMEGNSFDLASVSSDELTITFELNNALSAHNGDSTVSGACGKATFIEDNVVDTDIPLGSDATFLDLDRTLPPNCRYISWDGNFLWAMDDVDNTFPWRAYFSTGSQFSSIVEGQNPNWWNTANNFLDIGPDDGEPLLGMAIQNGVRYFMKPNRIYPVTGIAKTDLTQEPPLNSRVGAVNPQAFALGGDGNLWVMHSTGLHRVNGRRVDPVSQPRSWIGLFGSNNNIRTTVTAMPQWDALLISLTTGSDHFETWVYHIPSDSWYEWNARVTASDTSSVFSSNGLAYEHHTYIGVGSFINLYGSLSPAEHTSYMAVFDNPSPGDGAPGVRDIYAHSTSAGTTITMDFLWESGPVFFASPEESKHLYEVSLLMDVGGYTVTGDLELQVSLDGSDWTKYKRDVTATDITNKIVTVTVGARSEQFYWRLISSGPTFTGPVQIYGLGYRVEQSDPDNQSPDQRLREALGGLSG